MTEISFKCHRSTKSKIGFQEALKKFTFEGVIYQMVRHSKFLSSYTMFDRTFPAVVAQVSEQCVPSYFPTATVWGFTLCFKFKLNIGTSILSERESNFSSSFKCFPPRLYGKSRILKTVDKTFNSWICLILLRLTLKFIFYVHFKAWALGHQFQHIVLNTIQNIINRQAPFLSNVDTSKYIISFH